MRSLFGRYISYWGMTTLVKKGISLWHIDIKSGNKNHQTPPTFAKLIICTLLLEIPYALIQRKIKPIIRKNIVKSEWAVFFY